MTKPAIRWVLPMAALAALVLTGSGAASAAKPTSGPSLTLVFDDLPGDAIQSDGQGAYDARQTRDQGWTVSKGKRSMFFDFSTPLTGSSQGPFGYGVTAGPIEGVALTVTPIDDVSAVATFDFRGVDPDTWDATGFSLTMQVAVMRSGDTVHLTASSDAELWFLWQSSGPRGNGHFMTPSWELAGTFDMPWSAQVAP